MPAIGGMGAGQSLGNARGSISIDTSQLGSVSATVRHVGQQIEQSLGRASASLLHFGRGLNTLKTEIAAVGVAAGVLTKLGLGAAQSLRAYRVQFTQLLGDQEKANALMEKLTDSANEFGIEVTEIWQLGRALLPILKGGTAELDAWVKRAALLASTNPLKSTADAARAIQEYLAGQTISLQRLFNVDPNLIQEAATQFKDVGQQLDYILRRMGATEEGARQMADAWVGVKNELKLLLAEGFTPLLQDLRPVLSTLREWLSELRQTSPELLKFGASIAAIATVGAPALLFLGQMLSTAEKLQKLGLLAPLGKAGVLGGAAALGTLGGIELTRAVGRATGSESMANFNLESLWLTIRQAIFLLANAIVQVQDMIVDGMAKILNAFLNGVAGMLEAMGRFMSWLGETLPIGGGVFKTMGAGAAAGAGVLREDAGRVLENAERWRATGPEFLRGLLGFLGLEQREPERLTGPGLVTGAPAKTGPTAEQLAIIQQWADDVADLERETAQRRLEATRQYEQQRADVIAGYERQIAREAEDFARQRAREEQQLQDDIAAIRRDGARREAEWAQDLQDRLAGLQSDAARRIEQAQSDSARRIQEAQEDHARRMEQMQRDHRLRLLEAASRLDAQAVANEQRQYATARSDAERDLEKRLRQEQESLATRVQQERDNLAERIAQEQEAHAKRVAEARRADEQRIADMVADLRKRQALEDEDRAIRLARLAEDHQLQLQQLDAAHAERLAQIDRQAAEERQRLDLELQRKLAAENLYTQGWLELQAQKQAESLSLFAQFWGNINDLIRASAETAFAGSSTTAGGGSVDVPFQHGGPVPFTGRAMLHGTPGRPEYVLDAGTTDALRRMLGGGFTQAQLLGAVAGGGGRQVSVTIAPGAIVVQEAQSAQQTARVVRGELASLFGEMLPA